MDPSADPLSSLLHRADPAANAGRTLDPAAFSAAVHARIRSSVTQPVPFLSFSGWRQELYNLAAALAIIAALAAGGSLAYARHQRETSDFYADAYARSIDPLQMHASHPAR